MQNSQVIGPSLCLRLGFTLAMATAFAGCSESAAVSPSTPSQPVAGASSRDSSRRTKQSSLLYVSNQGARDVTVYAYSDGGGLNLVGTLTGFLKPSGMCTDKSGDVLITDSDARRVYRYHHGGTNAVAIIQERGSSVLFFLRRDPRPETLPPPISSTETANPSVSSRFIPTVRGTARSTTSVKYCLDHLAYDDKGNLFVDAQNAYNHNVSLLEMTKGDSYFVRLTVAGGALNSPSAIQWIKPTLLMGNETSDSVQPHSPINFLFPGKPQQSLANCHSRVRNRLRAFTGAPEGSSSPIRLRMRSKFTPSPGGALYSTLTQAISNPVSVVVSQAGSGS